MKSMRNLLAAALLVARPVSALETREAPELLLTVGEQRLLRVPGLLRYSLGSDAIAALRLPPGGDDRGSLLLKARKAGSSDLWIWTEPGLEHRRVRIDEAPKDPPASRPLLEALQSLEECEIYAAPPAGYVLRGEIRTLAEAARVAALLAANPAGLRDDTELAPRLLDEGLARLRAWIAAHPEAGRLSAELASQALWVRGELARPTERAEVERQLRALFPRVALELESLPDSSPTVHFRVYLLELKRTGFSKLGLGWPPGQEAVFHVTSRSVSQNLALDVAIDALEGEGKARVLSRPELVVRAPGEAELFAGGELPIRTQNQWSSNVQWKTYGLTLKLKVAQAAGGRVRLEVLTETSHLDSTVALDEIPALQANRMKTQVDARFGEPLFLSGLLEEDVREKAQGLPLLRRLPVLGSLFASEDYLSSRSELVVILVPRLAPPEAPLARVEHATARGPAAPRPRRAPVPFRPVPAGARLMRDHAQ